MELQQGLSSVACPTCTYDLAGIPDGPCPECGTPFSREAIALEQSLRTANRSMSIRRGFAALSLGGSVALCVMCRPWGEADNGLVAFWGMLAWGLALLWLFGVLPRLAGSPLGALWLLFPAIAVPTGFHGVGLIFALPPSLVAGWWSIRFAHERRPIATLLCVGGSLLLPATLYVAWVHAQVWVGPAWTWSSLDLPDSSGRWRAVYKAEARAYALTLSVLLSIGWVVFAGALWRDLARARPRAPEHT
ncbi:MAG: hypothetical protein WAZ94_12820 [Phycisphaerales bacterium]